MEITAPTPPLFTRTRVSLSLSVILSLWVCLCLFVLVCPCLYLYVPVCVCVCLCVRVSGCASLQNTPRPEAVRVCSPQFWETRYTKILQTWRQKWVHLGYGLGQTVRGNVLRQQPCRFVVPKPPQETRLEISGWLTESCRILYPSVNCRSSCWRKIKFRLLYLLGHILHEPIPSFFPSRLPESKPTGRAGISSPAIFDQPPHEGLLVILVNPSLASFVALFERILSTYAIQRSEKT